MKKICNLFLELGIIALIILPPIAFGAVQPRYIHAIQFTILAIGCVWVIKTIVKGSTLYTSTPLDLPFLLFLGLGLLNIFTSTNAHATEREVYLVFSYVLLYFLVVQQLRTQRRIFGLAFILVLVGSGESIFGLIQYLKGATTILGNQTPNIGTVNATYFSHNHFAGFLLLIIPIAFGLFLGTFHLEKRLFLFLLLGVMGAAFVLSLSRGGLLSLGCAGVLLLLWLILKQREQPGFWKMLVVLAVLVMLVGSVIIFVGISPIAHRSLLKTFFPNKTILEGEIRLPIWRSALPLIKEFPLVGSGLGTFGFVFQRYRPPEIPQDRQAFYAHNDYLELLIEMGIPALLLVIWGIYRFYWYVLTAYFRHDDPMLSHLAIGGLTSCTAILIHSFFDFNLQIPANALLFVIILALTTASVQLLTSSRRYADEKPGTYRLKAFSWAFAGSVLLVLVGAGFHYRQDLALRYYRRARSSSTQKLSLFEPIELYQKAIALDKQNPLFHTSLAEYYRKLGKMTPHSGKWYGLAAAEYQRAITLNPYDATSYYYLGWVYDSLNMVDKAIEMFIQAIAYNPKIAFYYKGLGDYYLSLGGTAQAIGMYQQALYFDLTKMDDILQTCQQHDLPYDEYRRVIPENAESRKKFAMFLARQHAWEASKHEYRQAIELSKGQPSYYQAMLQACQQNKDYPCLRELWQELSEQEPQNVEYPIAIANSFEQEQQWNLAIDRYKKIIQTFPDTSQAHHRLAHLYQQQGQPDEALRIYTRLLTQHPTDFTLYHKIAAIHIQKQDREAAIAIYQQALAAGLTDAAIYSQLGSLYQQVGKTAQAISAYQHAFEAGESRIAVYQTVENLYRAQGNTIGIEMLWETYAFINRQAPDKLFELVKHYQKQGEWLKAVTLAKEVIANAPTNANYRLFLAALYEQKNMMNEAKELYRRILRVQPDHQEAKRKLSHLGGEK